LHFPDENTVKLFTGGKEKTMAVKRYASLGLSLIFLLVFVCGIAGTTVVGETALNESKDQQYRYGHGWVNANLIIQEKDSKTKTINEIVPGVVRMKQTQTKFRLQIIMSDSWTIMKSHIYVSLENKIPMAANKSP
jgi:hypothetical protein